MTDFSTNATDDRNLLRLYAQGGEEAQLAFGQLVERYSGLIFGTAMRVCAQRDLATDATQNAFLALGLKASDLVRNGIPSVGAWLHRAAVLESKRLLRDAVRAERRHTMIRETMATLPALDAPDELDWESLRPDLDEAIEQLGSADRDILLLHYFEGLRFQEIALRLKMKPEAAQKRSVRALGKLSGMLHRSPGAASVAVFAAGLGQELAKAAPATLNAKILTNMAAIHSGASIVPSGVLTLIAMTNTSKFTLSAIAALLALLAVSAGTGYIIGEKTRPAPITRLALNPKPPPQVHAEQKTATNSAATPAPKPAQTPAEAFLDEMRELTKTKSALMKRGQEKARSGVDCSDELRQVETLQLQADAASVKLAAGEFPATLELIGQLTDWELRDLASRSLFFAWLKKDSVGALRAAKSAEHALDPCFGSWGRIDAPAAMKAMEELADKDQSLRRSLFKATLEGSLMADASGAVARIEGLEIDDQKVALASMETAVFYASKRPLFLQAIANVKDERLRLEMVGEVGKRLGQILPDHATAWFDTLVIENAAFKAEAAHRIFRGIKDRDPVKAADWFWSKIPPESQGQFLTTFVEAEWAVKDQAAAAARMVKHGIQKTIDQP